MVKKREFIPLSKYVGNTMVITKVKKWVWTKGHGLQVYYTDGLSCKSDYTLRELLRFEKVKEVL